GSPFGSLFYVLRCRFRSVFRSSCFVLRSASAAAPVLAAQQRAIFADQHLQVVALLVGELEEDLLALGVLEALTVAFEELVRAALAADADEQRLRVVHAAPQLVRALGEQTARRALEEEERRPRLEQRILRAQLAIPALQRAEVLLLFFGQLLEHRAAARVLGQARSARVELQAAALGRNRHPQRVA